MYVDIVLAKWKDSDNKTIDESSCIRLQQLPSIGMTCVRAMVAFAMPSTHQGRREEVSDLIEVLNLPVKDHSLPLPTSTIETEKNKFNLLQNRKVVFTGKLTCMSREEAKDWCLKMGKRLTL
jgi:NAD-dependent DNA ligase